MKRRNFLYLAGCLAVLTLVVWAWLGPRQGPAYQYFEGEIFGTHYRITYSGGADIEEVRQVVEAELDRIDWIASTWKPESELMRYNRASDPQAFPLSDDLAGLLELSREMKALTGGAFDVRHDGKQIDLSAIAKGYAVDRVADLLLSEFGATALLVDIGGEITARGRNAEGRLWQVGIYVPRGLSDVESPQVQLNNNAVATSGPYFKGDHITDPSTGEAARPELISASVIHPSATTADALATALFVMGPERGLEWASEYEVRAIFILSDGSVVRSANSIEDR